MSVRVIMAVLAVSALAVASPSRAQAADAKAETEAKGDAGGDDERAAGDKSENALEATGDDAAGDDAAGDDAAGAAKDEHAGDADEAATSSTDTDPTETDGQAYRFIGLRFRDFIVPKFMMGIFAKGGATVNAFTFGPEFTTRKDGLELIFGLSYGDYSMDPTLFRGKDEADQAYELVSSDMKLLLATIDVMFEVWKEQPDSRFAFLVGGGVGLGGVFGNLYRNQIYPTTTPPDFEDPRAWNHCAKVGDHGAWCDTDNDHYGNYDEPSWANGGSKPFIWPYITVPQLSFRYKPIKQLQMRFDAGFAITSGFFLGLSAAYGL